MENIFITIVDMSITGSMVAVGVMLARMLLSNSPKIFSYVLWSVVFFRLVCPFTIEGSFSLLPENSTNIVREQVTVELTAPHNDIEISSTEFSEITDIDNSSEQVQPISNSITTLRVMTYTWLLGVVVMLALSGCSLYKLHRNLKLALHYEDNIYFVEGIETPFVFGVIKPRIYLPLTIADEEIGYVIAHEEHHIKRFDYLFRIVAYIALVLHWFNPVVWGSYKLSERDMELSCDEAVLQGETHKLRGEYAKTLLKFSSRSNLVTPINFSMSDTKGRVKHIMKFQKTSLLGSIVACAVVVVLIVGCSSNSKIVDEIQAINPIETSNISEEIQDNVLEQFSDFIEETQEELLEDTTDVDEVEDGEIGEPATETNESNLTEITPPTVETIEAVTETKESATISGKDVSITVTDSLGVAPDEFYMLFLVNLTDGEWVESSDGSATTYNFTKLLDANGEFVPYSVTVNGRFNGILWTETFTDIRINSETNRLDFKFDDIFPAKIDEVVVVSELLDEKIQFVVYDTNSTPLSNINCGLSRVVMSEPNAKYYGTTNANGIFSENILSTERFIGSLDYAYVKYDKNFKATITSTLDNESQTVVASANSEGGFTAPFDIPFEELVDVIFTVVIEVI